MAGFFHVLDALVAGTAVVVDRPAGSAHPRFPDAVYPVDYGYLSETVAADGEGIDVFRGSAVGIGVCAVVFTVDGGKRDLEAKVLLDCDASEVRAVERFLAHRLGLGAHLVLRTPDAGGTA